MAAGRPRSAVEGLSPLCLNRHMVMRARGIRLGLVCGALLALAAPVPAALCGDAVDGVDVPCACGDVVVSSTVLSAADPVTQTRCAHDGLIIKAADGIGGLRLDLQGHTLRGSGAGVGLRVLSGGPGGTRIVSTGGVATLDGFDDGVVARGPDTLALLEDVTVRDSRRDGVRLTGSEFVVRRVTAERSGRDGFALAGRGFEVSATFARDSGRYGYFVMGDSGLIGGAGDGNVAERSGTAGFNLMGAGHTLADCVASAGMKDGVVLHATQLEIRDCVAAGNGADGIVGNGSRMRLAGNLARDNGGAGLAVRGGALTDAGGNRGTNNGTGAGEREAVQCEIGGTPCVL